MSDVTQYAGCSLAGIFQPVNLNRFLPTAGVGREAAENRSKKYIIFNRINMAPRKRTTNAKNKKNSKMPKLEAFLLDFDDEVNTIIKRLHEKTNHLLKDADNLYNMTLIKLPMAVRHMNWIQYCGSEKPETPVDESKQKEEAAQVELTIAQDHTIPLKSSNDSKSSVKPEDEENSVPKSTTKKGRPKKAPSTTKKARALSVSKQNGTIRKSTRKPMVTPARSFLDSSIMGPTPLVTPRFDSRLPKTPAIRVPRHREKVYSISVNGSPIAGGTEDIVINVPLGNGECIQLLASEMNSVDLSQLDEKAIQSIRKLQNRLTALCGASE
ncbi:borealin isoform X2 [Silurus meridionalis]|uniref:borealin isoform X2 n=1 Tax=Silurus meridionalis TaxID=175797 RepID=UPI001EEA8D58|nr:borealin isoform X2 [Silurus meridionalis]